jgi:superfamily II DNA/RNA helicase
MAFSDLGLSQDLLRSVADAGYVEPTPIQEQAIPPILMGRDILGCAQTGTGKTASFTLPMIDILAAGRARARMPRSLILEPTRELAAQVAENFDTYGKHHKLAKALIIGGESMADQIRVLERGADVLIATPGRLLDMFDRGYLLLSDVRILVIDEADRMLDMGFIPDVERIVSLVARMHQTMLFSATMPAEIRRLADAFLVNPKEIIVSPPATPAETVSQGVLIVGGRAEGGTPKSKREALRRLLQTEKVENALIFCNRKRDVGILERSLLRHGFDVAMLHGDLAQSARTEVLARFRSGGVPFLVCSDVAARGLDIAGVDAVVNFDVPTNAEDYVHRIGRTGRAGRPGRAFTVATAEDGAYLSAIERLIGRPVSRIAVDGVVPGELGPVERKGRRRRGRRGSPHRVQPGQPRPAPENAAAPAEARPHPRRDKAAAAAVDPPRQRQKQTTHGDKAKRREPRAEAPVVGMGDHVPAFLIRAPKPRT